MCIMRASCKGQHTDGVLAQLVERFNGIEEVSGSNPLCSTKNQVGQLTKGWLLDFFLLNYQRITRLCAARGMTQNQKRGKKQPV